jgi:FAD synthase
MIIVSFFTETRPADKRSHMWRKYEFIIMILYLNSCSPQLVYHESTAQKIIGLVEHGRHEARKSGFPTANVRLENNISILPGVYGCNVEIVDKTYTAMCYLDPCNPGILEVHLFNFKGEIYNQSLGIYLTKFIRAPMAFEDINALELQLKEDAAICCNL